MISKLCIRNFKCFTNICVPFSDLTLLAGANASGKSTLIQALLLLRQSHQSKSLSRGDLLLSGALTSVGTAGDAINQNAESDEVAFILTYDDKGDSDFAFLYESEKRTDYYLHSAQGFTYDTSLSIFTQKFNYLNSERVGPRLLYPMDITADDSIDVGVHGQYTADVLTKHRDDPLTCVELIYRDELTEEVSAKLESQTRYWMRTLFPNFDFQLEHLTSADEVSILLRTITPKYLRPTNIGFGIIYSLPIIVAALLAPQGSLLIVENPEAHLHPASQSQIGVFLARVASAGIQVIIETHSDHVLNGIRRAVHDEILTPTQLAIAFFTGAGEITNPKVYASGGIRPWPNGFFDQLEKDLLDLF